MITRAQAIAAKDDALARLARHGITDSLVIKLKAPKQADWVAMYRGGTQFTGRGRGPIFWLSSRTDETLAAVFEEDDAGVPNDTDVRRALVGSILHEYGHVIAEWAAKRSDTISEMLAASWPGESYGRPWDEEEFAEDFSRWLSGRPVAMSDDVFGLILLTYTEEAFV